MSLRPSSRSVSPFSHQFITTSSCSCLSTLVLQSPHKVFESRLWLQPWRYRYGGCWQDCLSLAPLRLSVPGVSLPCRGLRGCAVHKYLLQQKLQMKGKGNRTRRRVIGCPWRGSPLVHQMRRMTRTVASWTSMKRLERWADPTAQSPPGTETGKKAVVAMISSFRF